MAAPVQGSGGASFIYTTGAHVTGMSLLAVVATAFWAMLPAYLPNNAAVLFGGGPPIDGGRTWNGSRVLGDGKTWRGTGIGVAVGAGMALGLNAVQAPVAVGTGIGIPAFSLPVVVALPLGALVGDMAASFVKRRIGKQRGAPFPGVDQYDFVTGALLFAFLADPAWFQQTFTGPVLATVLVMTPVLHVTTNRAAYQLGFKDEPW